MTTSIDWNARARAQYLDPAAAVARVMREPTEREQLSRARYMLAFTRNPQYRFDLLASDIPAEVVSALEAIVANLAPTTDGAVLALAERSTRSTNWSTRGSRLSRTCSRTCAARAHRRPARTMQRGSTG